VKCSVSRRLVVCGVLGAAALAGARARAAAPAPPAAAALAELGRAIFFDASLSEPRGTSCASCHDPGRAFSGNHGSRIGVPLGSRPGHFARRSSPSLLYLKYVPRFRFFQEGDEPGAAPFGGLFWDGRVDTIQELVRQPLLNPDEMNDRDARAVATKIARASWAAAFRRAFGAAALDDPEAALASLGVAVEAFLTSDEMAPFSSRFDDVMRGRASFTAVEAEGMRVFKDPAKGACIGCHPFFERKGPDARGQGASAMISLFTDYGYDAVSPPRNPRLPPAARKPDLGLCERTDRANPSSDGGYCINFRTPSLRNVAVRSSYLHNGVFDELRDVVAFYATRDTSPRRWYRSGVKFEDTPPKYRDHVNVTTPPYNRLPGQAPALTDAEIDAVVAFLRTLTDARYLPLTTREGAPRRHGRRQTKISREASSSGGPSAISTR
jgi:cytochrome c peroxidase